MGVDRVDPENDYISLAAWASKRDQVEGAESKSETASQSVFMKYFVV